MFLFKKAKDVFFKRLKKALTRSHQFFVVRIESLIKGSSRADDIFFEELEEILVEADVGAMTTEKLIDWVREHLDGAGEGGMDGILNLIKEEMVNLLTEGVTEPKEVSGRPRVVLVVGVNGVGKTTSIAKLASVLRAQKKKVLLVAGDTFRAGAISQLEVWAKRVKAEIIKQKPGADPSAVIYDGVSAGISRKYDVVLIDTAGRLHNKQNLIKELEKIVRVIRKLVPDGPDETLLVLDATTGQNALVQAKKFNEITPIDGIVLTKLDGTAKGGIVVAIKDSLGIPIRYIGVGEEVGDLRPFEADSYIEALFED